MNIRFSRFVLSIFFITLVCCNSRVGNENTSVIMKTTLGDIKILLYDDTPVHRDNFIKLVNSGFYDGISFHRVINSFMIQAGDPSTRDEPPAISEDSLATYTIPAEIRGNHFHKKGALAAAREGNSVNPEMRSSGTQFYIVQGVKLTDSELDQSEQIINNNIRQAMFNKFFNNVADSAKLSDTPLSDLEIHEIASEKMFDFLTSAGNYIIPEKQRIVYRESGGVPRLDGTYTVFGEVIEGLDVVDRIAGVNTDPADKPLSDIKILRIRIISD